VRNLRVFAEWLQWVETWHWKVLHGYSAAWCEMSSLGRFEHYFEVFFDETYPRIGWCEKLRHWPSHEKWVEVLIESGITAIAENNYRKGQNLKYFRHGNCSNIMGKIRRGNAQYNYIFKHGIMGFFKRVANLSEDWQSAMFHSRVPLHPRRLCSIYSTRRIPCCSGGSMLELFEFCFRHLGMVMLNKKKHGTCRFCIIVSNNFL
jgi:hypothetical protein